MQVFVIHEDETILLMQRDKNKPNYPGLWESGAGGSVLKGENFEAGAKRELYEETGIVANVLEPSYTVTTENSIYKGYIYKTNIDKENIRLQVGETIAYRWVDKKEFLEIFNSEQFITSLRNRLDFFVKNDFRSERDCGFQVDNQWFRYRAAAIIIEDGHVLMVKNDIEDYYYSIGGGVHMGETSEQAVIREVKEEAGIDYEVERLAFINESFFYGDGLLTDKECHVIEFYYLMKPRGSRELYSDDTVLGVREHICWVPIEKFGEYRAFPLFYKEKLMNIQETIEHFVSDERVE